MPNDLNLVNPEAQSSSSVTFHLNTAPAPVEKLKDPQIKPPKTMPEVLLEEYKRIGLFAVGGRLFLGVVFFPLDVAKSRITKNPDLTIKVLAEESKGEFRKGFTNGLCELNRGSGYNLARLVMKEGGVRVPGMIISESLFGSNKDLETAAKKTAFMTGVEMVTVHPLDTLKTRLSSEHANPYKNPYAGVGSTGAKAAVQWATLNGLQGPIDNKMKELYDTKKLSPLQQASADAVTTTAIVGTTILPDTVKTILQQTPLKPDGSKPGIAEQVASVGKITKNAPAMTRILALRAVYSLPPAALRVVTANQLANKNEGQGR